jgi:hypothetical protein
MRTVTALALAAAAFAAVPAASAVTIDGTIGAGEWAGATTVTIGGGGTASFLADPNYVYGAFDITGWTAAMGAASQGNLLGFGVWKANQGYATSPGVEFQQSTTQAAWGNDGNSGTMNGLVSAFRINAQSPPALSIPGDLIAADSFATGNRVWEVKMPISSMAVTWGDTIWLVGGINYNGKTNWYPSTFLVNGNLDYAPLTLSAAPGAVPEPATWALMIAGFGLTGAAMRRRRVTAAVA